MRSFMTFLANSRRAKLAGHVARIERRRFWWGKQEAGADSKFKNAMIIT
jgi:hypothetical protein